MGGGEGGGVDNENPTDTTNTFGNFQNFYLYCFFPELDNDNTPVTR